MAGWIIKEIQQMTWPLLSLGSGDRDFVFCTYWVFKSSASLRGGEKVKSAVHRADTAGFSAARHRRHVTGEEAAWFRASGAPSSGMERRGGGQQQNSWFWAYTVPPAFTPVPPPWSSGRPCFGPSQADRKCWAASGLFLLSHSRMNVPFSSVTSRTPVSLFVLFPCRVACSTCPITFF